MSRIYMKNASGSPEIGTAFGVASTRKIRSVPGGIGAICEGLKSVRLKVKGKPIAYPI